MKLCECGCNTIIKDNVRFVHGHNRKNKKASEEHKKKISDANTGKIIKKETRDKIKLTLKRKWEDQNSVYHSEDFKKNRDNFYKSRIGKHRKEETKKKIGIKQLENWKNPNHLFNSKNFRNTLSTIHKKIWKDPESNYNSKNRSKKISKTITYLFTTKEFQKKYQKGLKAHKNKLEIKFENLLNKLEILSFKFVGDHSFWIGGKNPDFINEEQKMVIELFGDYWHGKDRTDVDNEEHELDRINYYKNHDYKCLVIWEHDMNNLDLVINKILEFIEKEKR